MFPSFVKNLSSFSFFAPQKIPSLLLPPAISNNSLKSDLAQKKRNFVVVGGRWSDEVKERRADEAGWGFEGGGEAGIMIMMRRREKMISAARKRDRVSGDLPRMGGRDWG